MGTRKKLVLASLVSVAMVLAFMIGLVPSYDTQDTGAEAETRLDMVDLLDMVLGLKSVDGVTVQSRVDKVVVKTPEDNADLLQLEIPVPLQANVELSQGDEADRLVTFVVNADDETPWGAVGWTGDVFTQEVSSPFVSAVDVSPFVQGGAGHIETTLLIYALVNATVDNTKATTLTYEAVNSPSVGGAAEAPLELTLIETLGSIDTDDNGLPDNVFDPVDGIQPGEIWVANATTAAGLRTVMIANLDNTGVGTKQQGLGDLFLSPTGNITVESPNTQDFVDAGLIAAGETGLLVVEVVDDLAALLDSADLTDDDTENGSAGDVPQWASSVAGLIPGPLTGLGQFVEISILYTIGAQYDEIEDLTGTDLDLTLAMSGLDPGDNANVQLWSYPTMVDDVGGQVFITNEPGLQEWQLIAPDPEAGGALNATIQTLSVFAPLNAGISIDSATPAVIPESIETEVMLTGVFPAGLGGSLGIDAARAAYGLYLLVNGVEQEIDFSQTVADAKLDVISELVPGATNDMYVTVPAIALVGNGEVDVKVVDKAVPANEGIGAGLLQVVATGTVTATPASQVTLDPVSGTGLPVGTYFEGDSVTATATPVGTETFTDWTLNGATLTTNPVTFSVVAGANALTANFGTPGLCRTLTVTTSGTGSGTVTQTPVETTGNCAGAYDDGQFVQLLATPALDSSFVNWIGTDANLLSATDITNPTITMNGDYAVTAVFDGTPLDCWTLTLDVLPVAGGTAVATTATSCNNGIADGYLTSETVTIVATPAADHQFVNWTGAVADANSATTTVVMTEDTAVTANFIEIERVSLVVPLPTDPVTGPEAWLFGGVFRTLGGTGFTHGMTIHFVATNTPAVSVTTTGFAPQGGTQLGTMIDVVLPPLDDGGTTEQFDVSVSTTGTLVGGEPVISYRRYADAGGVNTTAFIADSGNEQTVNAWDGATLDNIDLTLPALEATGRTLYGIVRNVQLTDVTAKANTSQLAAGFGTGAITDVEVVIDGQVVAQNAAGDLIPNASDFSFYLYEPISGAKQNTQVGDPALGGATAGDGSGNPLFTIPAPIDENGNVIVDGAGNPVSSPAILSFPVNGIFTNGQVDDGISIWGVQTTFDYVTMQTTVSQPKLVAYQSMLLRNEVSPNITDASDPAASPTTVDQARLYSLNGFSLRTGAILPTEVIEIIRLATESGTANGDAAGGTALKIVSPLGGLAYVDRVVLAGTSKAVGGTVNAADLISLPGVNENVLEFLTPASTDAGIVDVIIYLKSAPNTPAVTLKRVFEYTKTTEFPTSLLLILLGLLIAIIGLLAGGDSGGGGGGPCFIATAAYGTPMAGEIDTLRAVRDTYLLDNTLGTAFVDTYYRVSPAIADTVASSPVLAALVRVLLVPVIFLGKVALAMPALTALIGLSIGMALIMRRRARGRA